MVSPLMYVAPDNIWTRFEKCYINGIRLSFCGLSILMFVTVVHLVFNPLHENLTIYLFYSH